MNESNLKEDLSKTIILIEKINEPSNDKSTFTINVGIPICKRIFGNLGENLVAKVNELSNYKIFYLHLILLIRLLLVLLKIHK